MAKSTLSNASSEVQEKNFLQEEQDYIPNEKVIVAQEIPKMEEITFINLRDPGIPLHFHYHSKTHHLKHYNLLHGHKYNLPVEVIDHLEGNRKSDPYACHGRIYAERMKSDGVSEVYAKGYVSHFQCKRVR
jgi:hypothetical protein